MAIQYKTRIEGNALLVHTSGFDESLDEVTGYVMALIELCRTHQLTKVLCDERTLQYRLNTADTYALATFLAEHAPRVGRIAVVCAPEAAADAQFWENVVVNRGLTARAFKDLAAAERWLFGA